MDGTSPSTSGAPGAFIDAAHYADLIEHGGLVAALTATAAAQGLDVGVVSSEYASGAGLYVTAQVDTGRGVAALLLALRHRAFSVEIFHDRFVWADGGTSDLGEVVRCLAAWRTGIDLAEFAAAFPFMRVTQRAYASASGDPLGAQWSLVLADDDLQLDKSVLERLREEASLSGLFPFVSHKALVLTSAPRGVQGTQVRLFRRPDGSHEVAASRATLRVYGDIETVLASMKLLLDRSAP